MGVLLRQSMVEKSPHRHAQLDALQQKYKEEFCPQLRSLRTALKQRHAAMVQTAQAQASVRTNENTWYIGFRLLFWQSHTAFWCSCCGSSSSSWT